MAAIENTRPISGGHHIWGRIQSILSAIAAWNDARATRKALEQLTDRQLEDIGLLRGEIDQIRF